MKKLLICMLMLSLCAFTIDERKANVSLAVSTTPISVCTTTSAHPQTLPEQVSTFFASPLEVQWWPARWQCGTWSGFHGWLYIGSDLIIALSYFLIPLILLYFLYKRKERAEFKIVLGLFILFILACGSTHLMDAIMFWWPAYRLNALLRFATAIVSLGTAFMLVKTTPRFIQLRSPESLESIVKERTEELRKSMLLVSAYQRALDESAIVAITDQHGVIKHVNENFCKISKYSKEELIGKDHRIINSGYHPKEFIKALWATIISGNVWKGELQNKAKDGTMYWMDTTIVPFLNEQGKPYQYVAIRADITERKKAENEIIKLNEDLTRSEKKFRGLIENGSDIVTLLDENLMPIYRSPSTARLFGWTDEDIKAKANIEKIHPDDVEKFTNVIKDLMANPGISITADFRARHKNGHYLWIEGIMTNMIHDESIHGIVSNFHDVTERKKAEQKIIESELHYRMLVEQSPDGIFLTDAKGNYLNVNPAGCNMMGYIHDEIVKLNIYDAVVAEEISKVDMVVGKLASNDISVSVMKIKRKDGSEFIGEVYGRQLPDGKMQGILRDITERKKAESAIATLNENLEQKVIDRTNQLASANKELESFSYSVSHDLRAPLRAVNGYAKMLEEDYWETFDENGKRLLKIVQENAKQMGQLIDDLLSFSRLGRKEIQKAEVNMMLLAERLVEEIKIIYPKALIKIDHLHSVWGDIALLKQVLSNYILNAMKYSAKAENPLVHIKSEIMNDDIVYSVTDNGAGFDMEYAHKLFQVFQRLHSQEEFEGTGVGLAIVDRIIKKHHGKVWAKGEKGKGATFYFSLPVENNN